MEGFRQAPGTTSLRVSPAHAGGRINFPLWMSLKGWVSNTRVKIVVLGLKWKPPVWLDAGFILHLTPGATALLLRS